MEIVINLLTYADIAQILGICTTTVGRRAKRCGFRPVRYGRQWHLPAAVLNDIRFTAR